MHDSRSQVLSELCNMHKIIHRRAPKAKQKEGTKDTRSQFLTETSGIDDELTRVRQLAKQYQDDDLETQSHRFITEILGIILALKQGLQKILSKRTKQKIE